MINLTIAVDDINAVLSMFDSIDLLRYNGAGLPSTPVDLNDYVAVSGTDQLSNRTDVSNVKLINNVNQYYFTDPIGVADSWYISRYFNTVISGASGWSNPIQGDSSDIYHNLTYPPEINYSAEDLKTIDRIRILIGDPVELIRDHGEEAESRLHFDNTVFELDEKGWPASINMYGVSYNSTSDPVVNGYMYLKFNSKVIQNRTVISGVAPQIDIWYYTFRNSNREIMEAYNGTYPPTPLNVSNTPTEIYILQTAYDLLYKETWEAVSEDGAIIEDDRTSYDPSPGLRYRSDLLGKLRKRLDDAIKSVKLLGLTGVRVE